MSFSLYIWQQPSYGMHRNGASVWLCLGLAVACGIWSHYAVERPARRWLNAHKPRWPIARGHPARTDLVAVHSLLRFSFDRPKPAMTARIVLVGR